MLVTGWFHNVFSLQQHLDSWSNQYFFDSVWSRGDFLCDVLYCTSTLVLCCYFAPQVFCNKRRFFQTSGALWNDSSTLLSKCWPPWRVGTHGGELKGSKQSMLVPFHVKQKGLNMSRDWKRCQWNIPAKETWSVSLKRSLEVTWVSASAWFHPCSCYFRWFCTKTKTKTQRTGKLPCQSRTPLWLCILQLQGPPDTLSTLDWWPMCLMLHLPDTRISFQNLHLNRNEKNPPHACQLLSTYFQKVVFTVRNTFCWMQLTADIWYTQLLARVTHLPSSEARTENCSYYMPGYSCSHQVFLVCTIKLVHQTILSSRSCPSRCAHDFLI